MSELMHEHHGWQAKCELTDEEKVIADKAAKLIARDYGEVLKKLGDE